MIANNYVVIVFIYYLFIYNGLCVSYIQHAMLALPKVYMVSIYNKRPKKFTNKYVSITSDL